MNDYDNCDNLCPICLINMDAFDTKPNDIYDTIYIIECNHKCDLHCLYLDND
jgi:hypothetical protein